MHGAEAFGKYQLLARVASGGMAEVWLARSSFIGGFEKLLAIKRIRPELSQSQSFVSMFIDEAKLTVRLNHPNIVQVFDFGQVEADYFMAMEYVDGVDLATIAKQARQLGRPLPVGISALILRSVFDGLAHAHTRGQDSSGRQSAIIHRDVSPQNVLVSFDGQVKVSDFGIAKAASETGRADRGEIFGKLAYVSPEQGRGEAVDESTDVWSAGVVLFELLANQRLFARDNDLATLDAVESHLVPPPSTLNPEVPPELDALVLRALERDRSRRLRSAREAAETLGAILAKSFPGASPYALAEDLSGLWDGLPPRISADADRLTRTEGTRNQRPATVESTVAGSLEPTAAPSPLSGLRRRAVPSSGITVAEPALSAATVPASSGGTALHATLEIDPSGSWEALPFERRWALLAQDPNLWHLADLGEAVAAAGRPEGGRAIAEVAAAKFAQRGLLVQAACIYRTLLDRYPLEEPLRERIRRLPSFQGASDAQLAAELAEALEAAPELGQLAWLFEAGDAEVEVWAESPILTSLGAEQLLGLIQAFRVRRVEGGATLLREGDRGDSFFLLARGRVLVYILDGTGHRVYLDALSDGDCFGEHAFFTGEPRNATVEAAEPVQVLEVSREPLNRVLAELPTTRESLRRFYKERVAESLLARSPLFESLSLRARRSLAERFTFETYLAGDLVIREGDQSDAVYAIKAGSVQIYTGEDQAPVVLARLGPGELFGEVAAVEGTRRTASVRALEACELLRLEATELNAMLSRHGEIRRLLEQKIRERSDAKLERLIAMTE